VGRSGLFSRPFFLDIGRKVDFSNDSKSINRFLSYADKQILGSALLRL
jgi:hypothetical protein